MKIFYLTQKRKSAKTQSKIYKRIFASIRFFVCALILISPIFAQKLAVLTPEKNGQSEKFAEKLEAALSAKFKVLDSSLSETAFRSANFANPFNLSTIEAKNAGTIIGCNYFLLVKSMNQRRSSYEKPEYYESYTIIYAVSARTGRLIFWKLNSFDADKPSAAENKLFSSIDNLAAQIAENLKQTEEKELIESRRVKIEELPDENSPQAKNFRPPLPFRRIKPPYTSAANIYDVEATIDILVDVSEKGDILRTEIVRWAGFGLDESVTETIRKMQWRAAERDGKFLPMRVLLRYNFKKIEKDEDL